jgi:hypothetical protein
MGDTLLQFIPKQGAEILFALFLSFLIGLEREEQKLISEQDRFGGVRNFPLLGVLGYALCLFWEGNPLLPAVGHLLCASDSNPDLPLNTRRPKPEARSLALSVSNFPAGG